MEHYTEQPVLPGLEPGVIPPWFMYVKNYKKSKFWKRNQPIQIDMDAYHQNPDRFDAEDLRDGNLDPDLLYVLRLVAAAQALGEIGTRQVCAVAYIQAEGGELRLVDADYATATNGSQDRKESFMDVLRLAEPQKPNENH